jgi:8-oxo-dGTP diphosphatase
MNAFDYTSSLPMKRMAAGALFLNSDQQILIVQPTYREAWLVPGGVVEAYESPRAACQREVREELRLEIALGPLLCVEYRSPAPPKTECLQFIFSGGILSSEQIKQIRQPASELASYCFVTLNEAMCKLDARLGQRMQLALRGLHEARTIYAEDGVEIGEHWNR